MRHEARHVQVFRRGHVHAAPAGGQNRAHPAEKHGLARDVQRLGHVAGGHRAKADVHRLFARGEEVSQGRVGLIAALAAVQPEARHVDVLPPARGPGHNQRTDGVEHRDEVPAQLVAGGRLQLARAHAARLPPVGEVVFLKRADEQVAQLVGRQVPRLAHPLARRRRDGRLRVGVDGEILRLHIGHMPHLRQGLEHLPEIGAHDGLRVLRGGLQIGKERLDKLPQGVAHLLEKRHAIGPVHQIGHEGFHIAADGLEAQPLGLHGGSKIGKGADGHLMPPAPELAPQHQVGAHVAGVAYADHGDAHAGWGPPFGKKRRFRLHSIPQLPEKSNAERGAADGFGLLSGRGRGCPRRGANFAGH